MHWKGPSTANAIEIPKPIPVTVPSSNLSSTDRISRSPTGFSPPAATGSLLHRFRTYQI